MRIRLPRGSMLESHAGWVKRRGSDVKSFDCHRHSCSRQPCSYSPAQSRLRPRLTWAFRVNRAVFRRRGDGRQPHPRADCFHEAQTPSCHKRPPTSGANEAPAGRPDCLPVLLGRDIASPSIARNSARVRIEPGRFFQGADGLSLASTHVEQSRGCRKSADVWGGAAMRPGSSGSTARGGRSRYSVFPTFMSASGYCG